MPDYSPVVARALSSDHNAEHALLADQLGTSGSGSGAYVVSSNSNTPVLVVGGLGVLAEFRDAIGATVASIAQDGTITVNGQELGGGSSDSSAYPISEYGFISVSEVIGAFDHNSALGSWRVRMPVKANTPVQAVGVFLNSAGTAGTGGLNGFAVYSDDGQTLLGSTTTDNSLYETGGWRFKDLASPIPAQDSDRMVQVLIALNGYDAAPSVPFSIVGGTGGSSYSVYSGGYNKAGHRRSAFATISSFPATFNPTSHGTVTEYLPLVALA